MQKAVAKLFFTKINLTNDRCESYLRWWYNLKTHQTDYYSRAPLTVDLSGDAALSEQQAVLGQGPRFVTQKELHLAELFVQRGVPRLSMFGRRLPKHVNVPANEKTVDCVDHLKPASTQTSEAPSAIHVSVLNPQTWSLNIWNSSLCSWRWDFKPEMFNY